MVPEGWKRTTVGDLCDFINGNGFKSSEWSDKGLPIIRIQNLNGSAEFNYFSGQVNPRWLVNPGDILFAWAGTKGVSFGAKRWNGPQGVLNQHIFKVSPKIEVNTDWLYEELRTVTEKIENQAHGFKSTLVHVQKADITEQVVNLPPISEQKKIANIFSTWDLAITATERLLKSSQQQRKALMQKLLTGNKRLPGFQTEWKQLRLEQIFSRVTAKNTEANSNVVTISAQHGLIRQEDFFNKTVASEILDNYYLLKKGQFAYNKSYSNGYPMGAIKRLNKYEKGVVTTLYICFETSDERINSSVFFEHYFESGLLNKGLSKIANEGGRAHGLLNVKPSDFFGLKVFVPDVLEQKAIADVLTIPDEEIKILQAKLDYLKEEKRGLMQQLLSGKRRVRVDELEVA
ncbi:restriction endonuclease subunit S [Pseudomonas sp. YQ_6]|uniref:restriction endonuclease subunit S n=1 Tax=Pseudomonas sp. YQ_6 TaxID=3367230 RepID=UPI00370A784C